MMLPFTTGLMQTNHFDCEMSELADRHYSRQSYGARQFMPNGSKIVLRNSQGTILFGWCFEKFRIDNQRGYNCTIFRNESPRLSSEVILEAEQFAVDRWGPGRAFTFIDPKKVKSSNPGCCFKLAGWKQTGVSKSGKIILEKYLV